MTEDQDRHPCRCGRTLRGLAAQCGVTIQSLSSEPPATKQDHLEINCMHGLTYYLVPLRHMAT